MAKKKTTEPSLEERFVDEYLIDFDAFLAAVRCGVPRLQAKKLCKELLGNAEVQRSLIARVDAMQPSEIVSPQRILMGLMREAGKSAFGSDRIGALKQVHEVLKDLRKQAKEDTEDAKGEKRGGVMMVPGAASLTDWEKAATAMQRSLKEKVKE